MEDQTYSLTYSLRIVFPGQQMNLPTQHDFHFICMVSILFVPVCIYKKQSWIEMIICVVINYSKST